MTEEASSDPPKVHQGLDEEAFRSHVRERYSDVEIDLILELVSNLPIAVWAASGAADDYAVRLWNSGAERLYGFAKDEIVGTNYIKKFVNALERTQAIADHRAIEVERAPYRNLARDNRSDGTTRLLLTQGIALWNPVLQHFMQGEIAVDVTEVPTKDRDWLEQVLTPEVAKELLRSFVGLMDAGFESVDAMIAEADALIRTFLGENARSVFLLDRHGDLEVVGGEPYTSALAECEFDPRAVVRWCMATKREQLIVDYHRHAVPRSHGRERRFPPSRRSESQTPFAVALLSDELRPRGGIFIFIPDAGSFGELTESYLATLSSSFRVGLALENRLAESQNALKFVAMQRDRKATLRLAAQYRHSVLKKANLLRLNTALLEEATSLEEVAKITNALAAMSKSIHDAARQFEADLDPSKFALEDLVSSVTGFLMQMYPDLQVERQIGDQRSIIHGIAPFIEGALENLLINAVEAMNSSGRLGVWVTTTTRGGRGSMRSVVIHICDDGPGIAPEIRARLGDQGVSTKGDGRGFGLYVAMLSIHESGGEIALVQQPGWKGVCWRVTFPVHRK